MQESQYITAVVAEITVELVIPVNFSMVFELSVSVEFSSFAELFINEVTPYYAGTGGFQSIEVIPPDNVARMRRLQSTRNTTIDYEVMYDYKELDEAGGVETVSSLLKKHVEDGIFTVDNTKPNSLTYSTESGRCRFLL
ncbi:uncharacterized protein LOC144887693 [Branchiostoma floridae x Branchiostoma japonicum]